MNRKFRCGSKSDERGHRQEGPDLGVKRTFLTECRMLGEERTSIRTSGTSLVSQNRKVRPEGAEHQWRKMPPRELSVDLVADGRGGRVTGRLEAP